MRGLSSAVGSVYLVHSLELLYAHRFGFVL